MKINITTGTLWQVGTGDETRDYFEVFLQYGIACVGPGDGGREGDPETEKYYIDHPNIKNWGKVFKEIQKNDWIIAKKGVRTILAVGIVTSDYKYSDLLDDIQGWNLQHYVEVDWYQSQEKMIHLDGNWLGQSTMSKCHKWEVKECIKNAEFEKVEADRNLTSLKVKGPKSVEQWTANLHPMLDRKQITHALGQIIKSVNWYFQNYYWTKEDEIRYFLVLPLIRALGWQPEDIRLEYNNMDISLYDEPFIPQKSEPAVIIEVKRFNNGLGFTDHQIQRYHDLFERDDIKLFTTNGYVYNYYKQQNNGIKEIGSFNLMSLKERRTILSTEKIEKNYLSTVETIAELAKNNTLNLNPS